MQPNISKLHLLLPISFALALGMASAAFAADEYDSDYIDTAGIDEASESKGLLDRFFNREARVKDGLEPIDDIEIKVQEQEKENISENIAILRVIDKTLGKLYLLDLEVGSKRTINEITIKVSSCLRPNEKLIVPAGRAFIEVFETRKRAVEKLFSGWIYAQSPSVSHLNHPKYDVTLAGCKAGQISVTNGESAPTDTAITPKQASEKN